MQKRASKVLAKSALIDNLVDQAVMEYLMAPEAPETPAPHFAASLLELKRPAELDMKQTTTFVDELREFIGEETLQDSKQVLPEFANHPAVLRAAQAAGREYGWHKVMMGLPSKEAQIALNEHVLKNLHNGESIVVIHVNLLDKSLEQDS